MWVTSSLATAKTPTIAALGNFDGVHRGHRQVIEPIVTAAQPDCISTVVTFQPHPQEFFSGQSRPLLTPIAEKVECLRSIGVEQLVLLPFDRDLASLSPRRFVESILVNQLRVQQIRVGQDFCFGHKRSGSSADLQAIAASFGIAVEIVPLFTENNQRISSSAIRKALEFGEVTEATRLLGRPYTLVGEVVYGQQIGRTIDFPTANLTVPAEKFLPRRGVYCVWVEGAEVDRIAGVMNLGMRPTVNGLAQTIEIHLLDWSGDLYGKTLTVSLEKFLRPEQKFDSLDALKQQIQRDADQARSILSTRA
ncbi:bifunctional riboflavin kinase/FAD synthetase [Microcoleus sp. FACHB-1515]|uniref:bifunctional riboflavin kinase/FAD synthetase n=1 Tax=Cyanophyceae TaxID=3028117 RepID=UPI00168523D9|nr:bifunctional riboflavin kinase/FAD synthetase [Microcoleus sp. FACHB-1515]MBD2089710.1 bifunctional riboflavin kinase/FAD synthetase [Microcoleus sp. FACHB-1515]